MKTKKRYLSAALFLVVSAASGAAFSQSLSDFQWEEFSGSLSEGSAQTNVDPFSSGTSSAEDLSIEELQLSGIVYRDDEDAYALISGYLVKPGDRIAGYRVDLIEKDKVRLRRVDDVFILNLGGGI